MMPLYAVTLLHIGLWIGLGVMFEMHPGFQPSGWSGFVIPVMAALFAVTTLACFTKNIDCKEDSTKTPAPKGRN